MEPEPKIIYYGSATLLLSIAHIFTVKTLFILELSRGGRDFFLNPGRVVLWFITGWHGKSQSEEVFQFQFSVFLGSAFDCLGPYWR